MTDVLHEILDILALEDVLEAEGADYKKTVGTSGPQINIRECPRCGNSNWKVFANEESGRGKCFTCPEGEATFNLFTFTRSLIGEVSNRDTFRYLRDLAKGLGFRQRQQTAPVKQITSDLILPHSFPIPFNGVNLAYLEQRGVDSYVAEYFRLRFCELGFYKYEINGETRYSDFSSRVLFPVYDIDGTLKTFQGRDVTGLSKKKYLFPTGRAASGVLLYNAQNAVGVESVVIGEGVFDTIGLKVALDREQDLREVIPLATFGKHFGAGKDGDDQLSRILTLKRCGLKNVTFMWDGESSALFAAARAARRLDSYGLSVRVARLPEGKDPGKASPDEVIYAYRQAQPYSSELMILAELGAL